MNRNHLTMSTMGLLLAAGGAAAQTYVTKAGFFDPTGAAAQPFSLIQGAACATPPSSTMRIGPGVYHETPVLGNPMVLQASSTPVTIGQMGSQATSLRIVTYNCHLFGHETLPGIPRWLDSARTPFIGDVINDDGADIVGLQEVWEPDFFATIAGISGYPSGYYGGDIGGFPRVLNSGLAIYSQRSIQNPIQVTYNSYNATSFDRLATKGFVQCTIVKDGFPIGFFGTHTQSGNAANDMSARADQLNQLAASIMFYRTVHPDHAVVVVGDFNVPGETLEHFLTMRSTMGTAADTRDGYRNLPCTPAPACTSCATNQLNAYFNPGSPDTRLDYVLYAGSLDGTVDIVPRRYERRAFQIPLVFPPLTHDGLTTRDLSDHYGVFMEFELHRS